MNYTTFNSTEPAIKSCIITKLQISAKRTKKYQAHF